MARWSPRVDGDHFDGLQCVPNGWNGVHGCEHVSVCCCWWFCTDESRCCCVPWWEDLVAGSCLWSLTPIGRRMILNAAEKLTKENSMYQSWHELRDDRLTEFGVQIMDFFRDDDESRVRLWLCIPSLPSFHSWFIMISPFSAVQCLFRPTGKEEREFFVFHSASSSRERESQAAGGEKSLQPPVVPFFQILDPSSLESDPRADCPDRHVNCAHPLIITVSHHHKTGLLFHQEVQSTDYITCSQNKWPIVRWVYRFHILNRRTIRSDFSACLNGDPNDDQCHLIHSKWYLTWVSHGLLTLNFKSRSNALDTNLSVTWLLHPVIRVIIIVAFRTCLIRLVYPTNLVILSAAICLSS